LDGLRVLHGPAELLLPALPPSSVDAVVTDPPYNLAFMGKSWDSVGGPAAFAEWCRLWTAECLRVLKPGGHLLAFGGTRTYHRMVCGIEDAGFEIRDSVTWLYAQGFPKSLDVSKAIDRHQLGELRRAKLMHFVQHRGANAQWLVNLGVADGRSFKDWTTEDHAPSEQNWVLVRDALGVTPEEEQAFEREVLVKKRSGRTAGMQLLGPSGISGGTYDVTAPATDAARQWDGWGTALKPASEPIVVARKPLFGTVAANVTEHGTGALNIDACRTGAEKRVNNAGGRSSLQRVSRVQQGYRDHVTTSVGASSEVTGRWPTNVVLSHAATPDGEDACADGCVDGCPVAELDAQSGITTASAPGSIVRRRARVTDAMAGTLGHLDRAEVTYGDTGGASRFFPMFRYQAKAPTRERPKVDGVAHSTVKPLALMRWLVRLVTPPGGTVLDPFAGSGTTLEACGLEGFGCIGIEREAEYLPLIQHRLDRLRG